MTLDKENMMTDTVQQEDAESFGHLPFTFSKKHAVVLSFNSSTTDLCYKSLPDANLLLEVRRVLGHPFALKELSQHPFK